MAAALPDGAHGVDYVPGFQAVTPGQLGPACFTAVEGPALRQQLRSRSGMDGAVHAAAAQKGGVGGIDNGLRIGCGQITCQNGKTRHEEPFFRVFLQYNRNRDEGQAYMRTKGACEKRLLCENWQETGERGGDRGMNDEESVKW